MEHKTLAPTPTNAPKAEARFMNGPVKPTPAILYAPRCPMKIPSTILYMEEAIIAAIAGRANFHSNLPIFSLPRSKARSSFIVFWCFYIQNYVKRMQIYNFFC